MNFVKNLTTKPIWVTEIGYPSIDSEEDQANYLISIYETISLLVEKIFIYELVDNLDLIPEKENHFGLLTIIGTKKEAYSKVWEIAR